MVPDRLIEGSRSLRGERPPLERRHALGLSEPAQNPDEMATSCRDGSVSPEIIFDSRPGELPVVRDVAILVQPFSSGGEAHSASATLEDAVRALKVKQAVVMGRSRCAHATDAA